ncbi:MAG: multiprotein bridging factor aMBF1 [Halobacteriales archaeon]
MVQCEMCGVEIDAPKTVKIEGAELQVCGDCADFGTEVETGSSEETTSTKYSTSSSSSSTSSASGDTSGGGGGSRSRRDLFDEMEEIVPDFGDRIREGREDAGHSQAELADQLNEKTSLIRKLERGEHLPNDTVRRKLERALDITLVEGGGDGDGEDDWSSDDAPSGMTLGDVVKRKD